MANIVCKNYFLFQVERIFVSETVVKGIVLFLVDNTPYYSDVNTDFYQKTIALHTNTNRGEKTGANVRYFHKKVKIL